MKRLPSLCVAAMMAAAMMTPGFVRAADAALCTDGIVGALFQNYPRGGWLEFRGHLHARFVDVQSECQYRVFFDRAHVTFNEDDVFLGGIAYGFPYKALGISRNAAIAEIEMNEDRVWLAEVMPHGKIGALVEQPLMRTAYGDFLHPVDGLTVGTAPRLHNAASPRGLCEHLGEQVSWKTRCYGEGLFTHFSGQR
jgi:hypothetical protein